MQSGNLPTSFSQIPASELMQHYFNTLNLYKKDSKHSQNLSLGSQQININNTQRNSSTNISKQETNNTQIKTYSKIPQETPSKIDNIPQNLELNLKTYNKSKIPISKNQRNGQNPINQSGSKLKFAPQLHQQKSFTTKSSNDTTKYLQDSISLSFKQQQSTESQNSERSVFINKENIHNNILDQLQQYNMHQQINNNKNHSITNKILSINSTLPKSARWHSQALNQSSSVKVTENQKSQTLKDKNEMKYFRGQLAITSQQQKEKSNLSSIEIKQDMKQQSNNSFSQKQDQIQTCSNLKNIQRFQDQNQLNIESKCFSDERSFVNIQPNYFSNESNQQTKDFRSLPNNSTERSTCSLKLRTKSDMENYQDNQYCLKHPNKKGKYIVSLINNNVRKQIVCSKCAIEKASQIGYKIEEIVSDNTQNQMKLTMDQLIIMIKENQLQHENILSKVSFKKSQLFSFYIKSAQLVENVFLKMERQLIEKKNQILNELNKQKIQNENTYSLIEQEAKDILNKLNQISNDVLLNHDSILQSIELEPFNTIIQNYQQKIKIINDYFLDLKYQTIPLMKVSTECSNNIIEQIFQIQHYQTTLLKKNDKILNSNKEYISKDIQNKNSNESNQSQEEIIQNNLNLFDPSQISTLEYAQEDERAQFYASPIQQGINFQQLLEQQQGNQINQFNINNNIKNIVQQAKSPHDEISNMAPSTVPISQIAQFIVKPQTNLEQQIGIKDRNFPQYPVINSLNQNNNTEDHFIIAPDIFQKKIKFNKKISTDDTSIALLYNNININPNDFEVQYEFEQNKQQQLNNQYLENIQYQQQMLQQDNQNQINLNNQQDKNIYWDYLNINNYDKDIDQFKRNCDQFDKNTNLKQSSENSIVICNNQERNKNNTQLFNDNQIQKFNKSNNYRLDAAQLSDFQNTHNSNLIGQDSLKQNSLNEQKQQSSAFRVLFSSQIKETISEEPPSASKSNTGKDKYKNILEKIHANQTRNNTFYSDLIKTGSVSPKVQNIQSPANDTQFNQLNNNSKNIQISQFNIKHNNNKIVCLGQNVIKQNYDINQNQNNNQYDQDSNNFTVNNSLLNEDDESLQKDDENIMDEGFNFVEEDNNIFKDQNNLDKINYNFNLNYNTEFNHNINNHTPTKSQQLTYKNNNNLQSDSFSLCIQRYPKIQRNQTSILNEYQNNHIQVDQSNSLQVVQKSYSQLCGNMQTRESFVTNSIFKEGNSLDFRDSSDQRNSYRGLQQLNSVSQITQNRQLMNQNQHDINNINGNQFLQDQQHYQKMQMYLQQQNQFQNINNHTFSNTLQDMQNEINSSKEQKGFRDFINLLENRIEEENQTERSQNKSDYRKTLFFSPKFNTACNQQTLNVQSPLECQDLKLNEEIENNCNLMQNNHEYKKSD